MDWQRISLGASEPESWHSCDRPTGAQCCLLPRCPATAHCPCRRRCCCYCCCCLCCCRAHRPHSASSVPDGRSGADKRSIARSVALSLPPSRSVLGRPRSSLAYQNHPPPAASAPPATTAARCVSCARARPRGISRAFLGSTGALCQPCQPTAPRRRRATSRKCKSVFYFSGGGGGDGTASWRGRPHEEALHCRVCTGTRGRLACPATVVAVDTLSLSFDSASLLTGRNRRAAVPCPTFPPRQPSLPPQPPPVR